MPEDPECFSLSVEALIGVRGVELSGEEIFNFLVCTPRWLATEVLNEGYVFGKDYLFLPRYDYALMRRAIEALCDRAEGPDWNTVAAYVAQYSLWEFENYQSAEQVAPSKAN